MTLPAMTARVTVLYCARVCPCCCACSCRTCPRRASPGGSCAGGGHPADPAAALTATSSTASSADRPAPGSRSPGAEIPGRHVHDISDSGSDLTADAGSCSLGDAVIDNRAVVDAYRIHLERNRIRALQLK